ncbi:Hypothetical predicted protein [Cloeon dipterum]|uniref:Transporter n=1 Tax=Cloeon dipterum TaxID=197152 RepID=A0A8S1CFQ4_9INSE|nr:Hypothetical predicted protein [Cloeon dipterum]
MTRFDLISPRNPIFDGLNESPSIASNEDTPGPSSAKDGSAPSRNVCDTDENLDFSIRTDITSVMDVTDMQTSSSDDEDVVSPDVIPRFVRPSMRRIKRIRLPATENLGVEHLPPPLDFASNNEEANSTMTTDVDESYLDTSSIGVDIMRRLDSSIESNLSSASTVEYAEARAPELPSRNIVSEERRDTHPGYFSSETSFYNPSVTPSALGQWPFQFCFSLSSFGCVIGLYSLSRFAILSAQFGGSFLVQFSILSVFFGIPLYLFHVALGHYLGSGVINMWKISPIFQGVGIALLIGQAFIGFYGIAGISWLLVYLRDSFIRGGDSYRWVFPLTPSNTFAKRDRGKLEETVSDYFYGVVLKRSQLYDRSVGHFKFVPVFNLAVVWVIVFLSLSKGVKTYTKVLTALVLLSLSGLLVVSSEIFYLSSKYGVSVIAETTWDDVFYNGQSWIAAASETFLTWGLLGAATMQSASHCHQRHKILRQTVVTIVAVVLCLALIACLADACSQILLGNGFQYYHTSSFELMSTAQFMRAVDQPVIDPTIKYMAHSSLMVGNRVIAPMSASKSRSLKSGYQAIRLVTELLPATFATLGVKQMSPCWAVLTFLTLIFFGLLQQLAVWHSVISGIISISSKNLKPWRTTIAFFTCIFACVLGLPLTTELGIWIVYFLDTVVGNVRGHPYNGEVLANVLLGDGCRSVNKFLSPVLAFIWSVALPVYLLGMTVLLFFSSESVKLYDWNIAKQNHYWEVWARELGSCLQLLPILLVPLVAIVQTCRYLSKGPDDILERVKLLYRPPPERPPNHNSTLENFVANTPDTNEPPEAPYDPPPKYTPPPSYSTATGARIAHMLRQSFRHSMRRISASSIFQSRNQNEEEPRPPAYTASVAIEMHQPTEDQSLPENMHISEASSAAPVSLSANFSERSRTLPARSKQLTAPEVAKILRGSFRRSQRYRNNTLQQWNLNNDKTLRQTEDDFDNFK